MRQALARRAVVERGSAFLGVAPEPDGNAMSHPILPGVAVGWFGLVDLGDEPGRSRRGLIVALLSGATAPDSACCARMRSPSST
jgi:hypothetical protein